MNDDKCAMFLFIINLYHSGQSEKQANLCGWKLA